MTFEARGTGARAICGCALIAMLAAMPVAMSLGTKRGFVLIKFAIGLPLATLAAIAAFAMCLSERDPRGRPFLRGPELLVGLGLAGVAVLSASQAADWEAAWLGGFFRLEGAVAWIAYAAVYLATAVWIRCGGNPASVVDAIILGSIAPAWYAVQQGAGWDFMSYGYGDAARSSGTMGNPMFMGAYLAMCLPLVIARIGMCDATRRRRLALGFVGILQAVGLFATAGRGALFGLVVALIVLACCRAVVGPSRKGLAALGCMVIFVPGALAWINLTDAGSSFARASPSLVRWVVTPEGHDPASRSIQGRLAAWSAGDQAFRQATGWRNLVGYGPDVAHAHYYAFVPAQKMRTEDFRAEQVFDRVHADALDVVLAIGMLGGLCIGVMLGLAFRQVSIQVFGCSTRTAAFCVAAGAAVAAVTWQVTAVAGGGALRWPLAGFAFGAGWLAAVSGLSLATRRNTGDKRGDEGWLVAGCAAALLAYWMDAQIGLPVFVTRIIFFALLGLVTALPSRVGEPVARSSADDDARAAWLTACGASALSFLPAYGADLAIGAGAQGWARWFPIIIPFLLGRLIILKGGEEGPTARMQGIALVLCLVIAVARYHVALPTTDRDWPALRGAADALLPLLVWVAPLVLCLRVLLTGAVQRNMRASVLSLAMLVGMGCAAWPAWCLMVANVAGAGSEKVDATDADGRIAMLRTSLEWAPWEWQYRHALVYEAVPAAAKEMSAGMAGPDGMRRFRIYTELAESVARAGYIDESEDPWQPFLVAVPLHLRGLNALWTADPEGVGRASDQADALYALAHRRFPVHPLILQQWILLKFDRGEYSAARELIDHLQKVVPNEPEPYVMRVEFGKRTRDRELVSQAVEAARKALNDRQLAEVLSVAN